MSGHRVLDLLRQQELTNMLKPLPGQYRPDGPMPVAPDVDYCPYPAKLICDDHSLTRRTMDGSCNSLVHPLIGRSMTPFRRLVPARYDDGNCNCNQAVAVLGSCVWGTNGGGFWLGVTSQSLGMKSRLGESHLRWDGS